jgi:hypothetical protein
MPLTLAKAQEKIQTRIFNGIGSYVTIQNVTSSTFPEDDYDEPTLNYGTGTLVKFVPFNAVEDEMFQAYGDLLSGELDMIIPYGQTVTNTTKFTYDGDTYIIKALEKYPYQGGSLAYAVRLAKTLSES